MGPLDFSDFILEEEDQDERTERDPYTIAQGEELFRLGIWTGGSSVDLGDRLPIRSGGFVWHDAAYWIMPIVWYSGMRREEACKLLVDDIGEEDGAEVLAAMDIPAKISAPAFAVARLIEEGQWEIVQSSCEGNAISTVLLLARWRKLRDRESRRRSPKIASCAARSSCVPVADISLICRLARSRAFG